MSSACTIAQANAVRAEAAKSSDAFLPPEDRRSRPGPILVGAAGVPIYANYSEQKLDAIVADQSVEVLADSVVYFYGNLQARVIGHGRGHPFVEVAWVDGGGLSMTDCHGAFIKTQPFSIIEGTPLSEGADGT